MQAPLLEHRETIFVTGLKQLPSSLISPTERGPWFYDLSLGTDNKSLLLYEFVVEKILHEICSPLKLLSNFAMDVSCQKCFPLFFFFVCNTFVLGLVPSAEQTGLLVTKQVGEGPLWLHYYMSAVKARTLCLLWTEGICLGFFYVLSNPLPFFFCFFFNAKPTKLGQLTSFWYTGVPYTSFSWKQARYNEKKVFRITEQTLNSLFRGWIVSYIILNEWLRLH